MGPDRVRAGIGTMAGAAIAGLCLWVALAAADRSLFLVPAGTKQFPSWLAGPLAGSGLEMTGARFGAILIAAFAAYVVAVACAEAMPVRVIVAAIVSAHVVVALAPPLLSADVFGYIGYARLGTVHDVSPYVHGAAELGSDPVRPFVRWRDIGSPYGPLFTLCSYPLAALSPSAGLWLLKALFTAASLGLVALVARLAERTGGSARGAAVLVGLNPILLLYGVGGAHNDMLLALGMAGAIALVLRERPAASGALLAATVAVKASAVTLAPFLLIGVKGRRRALAGVAGAGALLVVVTFAAFGGDALELAGQLSGQQGLVADHSVPRELFARVGYQRLPEAGRVLALAAAMAVIVAALWWALRTGRWVTGAGWAMLAVLCGSTWLLPWYAVWPLPLAAISGDRWLRLATLAFTFFVVLGRAEFLFA